MIRYLLWLLVCKGDFYSMIITLLPFHIREEGIQRSTICAHKKWEGGGERSIVQKAHSYKYTSEYKGRKVRKHFAALIDKITRHLIFYDIIAILTIINHKYAITFSFIQNFYFNVFTILAFQAFKPLGSKIFISCQNIKKCISYHL